MHDLSWLQYACIFIIFVWSSFVRTGFGFGGALLSMPFLLLVHNEPLVYLPVLSVHLLIFASLTIFQNYLQRRQQQLNIEKGRSISYGSNQGHIDWTTLRDALKVMLIPKLIGVAGIIVLPAKIMGSIIFVAVSLYALTYLFNRPLKSPSRWVDNLFLMIGAYMSGVSLMGGPLMLAVMMQRLTQDTFRDSIFVLWFILVAIKFTAFIIAGIDLQLIHQTWLLPAAFIGHLLGQYFHHYLKNANTIVFYRIIGALLLTTSVLGLAREFGGL